MAEVEFKKTEHTTIRIPKELSGSIDFIKAKMVQIGLEHVGSDFYHILTEEHCPFCFQKMETIEIGTRKSMEYAVCSQCGLGKPVIRSTSDPAETVKLLTAGFLIGLGIFALAKLLKG